MARGIRQNINEGAEKMTAQTEIIDAVSELAGINNIGLLSPAHDYAVQFAGGTTKKRYLDGSGIKIMRLLVLAKSKDQLQLSDSINGICGTLEKVRRHKGNGWEIRRIEVGTPPAPKGYNESGGEWIYSCVLSVEYYYNEKEKKNI